MGHRSRGVPTAGHHFYAGRHSAGHDDSGHTVPDSGAAVPGRGSPDPDLAAQKGPADAERVAYRRTGAGRHHGRVPELSRAGERPPSLDGALQLSGG